LKRKGGSLQFTEKGGTSEYRLPNKRNRRMKGKIAAYHGVVVYTNCCSGTPWGKNK
jgi:hypothetical protein